MFHNQEFGIRILSSQKEFYFGIPWDCFLLSQLLVRILKSTSRCKVSEEGRRVNWHEWMHRGWDPAAACQWTVFTSVVSGFKLRTGSVTVLLGSPQEILEISWILTLVILLFLCIKLFWNYANLASGNNRENKPQWIHDKGCEIRQSQAVKRKETLEA